MKYYIIAGEASGDLHASNLMRGLKAANEQAEFRFWGGDLMEAVGGTLVKHYRDLAFMGFVEVVKNLRTILGNIKKCKADIESYQPDVLILVDYPGFNLRIADWAKKQGLKVFYYISPQIWAWHKSRIHQIKQNVDRMFVILPFEKAFYEKHNYEVEYHGHPLIDVIETHSKKPDFLAQNNLSEKPIIALLPGSRRQEIDRLLSVMLEVIPRFPNYQFVIAAASATPLKVYEEILAKHSTNCKIVQHQTYDLLQHSKAALVTSGTATLETSLFHVPQVVCYKTSPLTYFIAKNLVDIKYISLVNLIADRPLVKELIQGTCNLENLTTELNEILEEGKAAEITEEYGQLKKQLGELGVSKKIGERMMELLTS